MRIILSVGGGGKGSENFAAVACSLSKVETFVHTARGLVDEYGLDGIDVDWEQPADSKQGKDYVRLLARLRQALPAPRYVLATCLPAGQWALQNIDLSEAETHLDMINLMAYDFSGPWIAETGHQAQLYGTPTSCYLAVSYVLSQGVPSRKLILGVPTYGRSFLGSNGPGQGYTACGGEDGVFDYCDLPRPGSQEILDNQAGAAYCVGGDGGFVTYDIPATVQQKAQLVTTTKLGGLFYWNICSDSRGPRSLIETGYNTLHDM
ncbi:hypothetical protein N7507_009038 [Penicillium longicatenatum]|nr:hypothetical protein N7507_009038 [Penicillium longicatenatum]